MDDHSLSGYGEDISHGEHTHISHYIIHFLQNCEEIGAACKWWGGHPSFYFLWQWRVKLRWLHLRDHCPSPLLHMAAIMILLMVPLVDIAIDFLGSMIGGETHWVNVSLEGENSHTLCTTCYKGSMGDGMATTATPLFPYKVSHMRM